MLSLWPVCESRGIWQELLRSMTSPFPWDGGWDGTKGGASRSILERCARRGGAPPVRLRSGVDGRTGGEEGGRDTAQGGRATRVVRKSAPVLVPRYIKYLSSFSLPHSVSVDDFILYSVSSLRNLNLPTYVRNPGTMPSGEKMLNLVPFLAFRPRPAPL